MFDVYANGESIFFPLDEELIITKPKLTLEMGKAGSFEFSIPPTNRYYSRLQKIKTIITVEYDGVEIFRGRVLTNNRGFNNVRKIYCEGDLAYLVDSVQKGEKYTGKVHDLFRSIVAKHNARVDAAKRFTVGNITVENREIFIAGTSDEIKNVENKFDYKQIAINSMVDEWNTTLDYITSTIIDYCGGYLRTRRVGDTTYLDLLKDYGRTAIQRIEFGKNLIDLTEEVKAEDLYTVLIPLGDDNLTIASVNNGSDELVDTAGVALYGRIVKTNVFDSVNTAQTLLENGQRMLADHENMPITITVKAVDMHLLDDSEKFIYVGDRVYVNSIPHDITEYLTCTKIEYDFENHANDTYTFGNPKQTMTQRYKKDKQKSSRGGRGRSGGASGGVGAAVEEAAEDFAISEAKKTSEEVFDAWIKVDKAAGRIDLEALYKQVQDGVDVLKNNVGINLNAPAGTVDIYSMNTKVNRQGNLISESEARIQTLATSQEAQIREFTRFTGEFGEFQTSITQRTDATEASIKINAQKIAGNTTKVASIEVSVNDIYSKIKLKADKTELTSAINTVNTVINQTNTLVNTLNADFNTINTKVTTLNTRTLNINSDITKINGRLEGLEAKFKKIESDISVTGWLRASNCSITGALNVNNITVGNSITATKDITANKAIYMNGNQLVATRSWVNDQLKNYLKSSTYNGHTHKLYFYHTHTVKVDNTTYTTAKQSRDNTISTGGPA